MSEYTRDDAVDEENFVLCCACCCANASIYADGDCIGCSGKAGICCLNLQCCCKPSAPCLVPFGCVGIRPECDGCSVINMQCQACCLAINAAIPCNKEVPLAVSVLGLTLYPVQGCCVKQGQIMER
uniref:Uncharacterized protein n=1 Tax=Amphora coffeiformis TaxID=265554 RepID=A0A7S3P8Z5_9STRA|eukprot:scaffold4425_cov168-Amphora_coffeaeformis.AAC.8